MPNNPLFKGHHYNDLTSENTLSLERPMTVSGTINKTMILLFLVVLVAYYTWTLCTGGYMDKADMLLKGGLIAGFILALITAFNPKASPITSLAYAGCEGLVIGVISYSFEKAFGGIIFNSIAITLLTLFAMLFLYKAKIIVATEKFKKVVFISTAAIAIFYLAGMIGAFLGHPMTIFNGGLIGIGISLLICAIAALNFVNDFDFIEKGAQYNYPNYFEWYGAFGLLVTLVWLYIEVIKLLAQTSMGRD